MKLCPRRLLVLLGDEMWDEKINIERAMGPWILMASAGWENTTTNQKATGSLGNIWGRGHTAR
jgi:hypothetical protein